MQICMLIRVYWLDPVGPFDVLYKLQLWEFEMQIPESLIYALELWNHTEVTICLFTYQWNPVFEVNRGIQIAPRWMFYMS